MNGQLELAVLGKPQLKRDGQLLTDLLPVKGLALLIYLAVTRQPYSRSALAGLLWSEMPEEIARTNLRLCLSQLRKVAGHHLTITRHSVAFNVVPPCWLDVTEFEAQASEPEQADIESLRAAVNLYQGDFLDDFYVRNAPIFEEWVLLERERLRQVALKALFHLIEEARQQGDFREGIRVTRRLLTLAPWHEEAHRQLMWLLAYSGQRSVALAQYEVCQRALAEELGVEPAPATHELYEQIKAGATAQQGSPPDSMLPLPPRTVAPLHNLPPQLTPLVGREAELAQIAHLLTNPSCRLLTLMGPGGIGKTRLALAAVEAQLNKFQNGVRFVSLVGVSPVRADEAADLLINNIANALNYTFSAQRPPRELLLNHLADKEMLLLLDNFEQLRSAAEFVTDILQHAPGVKLLVTSRERLGVEAEWLFDIEGLPYPPPLFQDALTTYPAVRLFFQTAQRIKPEFTLATEETAVTRICQLVAGFPLALELAANWVRVLTCAEIATRLERDHSTTLTGGLDILTTTTSIVVERHQSMRAVLAYSWSLLSEEEQRTFRCLSVFQGGFELDAAEQVTSATLPVLAGLVDKSWLRRDPEGRYRMHELLRQYGVEQLAAYLVEQTAMQQNHCHYYANFLETRCAPLQESAAKSILAELDREVENIRAAWEWLLAQGELKLIAAYLEGLWPYYQHKGWFQEAVFVLNQVHALEQVSAWQKARWQRWLGDAYYQMGHLQESRDHLEYAMALLGRRLPATPVGWALTLLWQALHQAIHRLWPFRFVERSPQKCHLLLEAARTMGHVGQIYYFSEEKLPLLTAALYDLNLVEQAGSAAEVARGYSIVSLTLGNVPLHRLANLYSQLAQEAMQRVNRLSVKAYGLEIIGAYKMGLGHWTEAAEAINRSAELMDRLELRRWWEETGLLLALTAYHQGRFTQSMQRFTEVSASAQQRGDPLVQFWGLLGQAENALRLGGIHADNVMFFLEKARALPEKYLGLAEIVRLQGILAVVYLQQNNWPLARQAAQRAMQLIQQSSFFMFWSMEGYAAPAEVFLMLWEKGIAGDQTAADQKTLAQSVREACQTLHKFARIFPPGQPRAWLYQGLYHWLEGKSAKAHQAWRKSLVAAEQLAMSYEQGRAHYEIGRHLSPADPARQKHLTCAGEIFTRLKVAIDLDWNTKR